MSIRGSSLVETAMVMPVLVLMLCFAIDIGYFFIVAANLVSSSRIAVLYSGQGFVSPASPSCLRPEPPGSLTDTVGVAGLAGGDLSGLGSMALEDQRSSLFEETRSHADIERLHHKLQHLPFRLIEFCAPTRTRTSNYGMLTQRVDVVYTVIPPIPVDFFTFTMPPLTVHWQAEMRALD